MKLRSAALQKPLERSMVLREQNSTEPSVGAIILIRWQLGRVMTLNFSQTGE